MIMILAAAATLTAATLTAATLTAAPADAAGAHQLIQGSGSSWSANAVQQWISDVNSRGLQVVFNPGGSAAGRIDFANRIVDFAVSDVGFQGRNPVTGASDTSNGRDFAYLPIVAGGTALPYHIVKNGQLVHDLRLSGATVAKIFARQITNWADPQITKDNNGNAMPKLAIIPVQHSEGSGASFQFSAYLHARYPTIWKTRASEYFPTAGGNARSLSGSDGVMNFLTSSAANGAIGYDEYSYALAKQYPVAKVLNKAGYYTLPSRYNVAIALTQARINSATQLQSLANVYTYDDPRTYPISSYSYAIIPTGATDPTMNTAKRQTLNDYLHFGLCDGQGEIGAIGYSPLPLNLVQAGFDQLAKLHTADPSVDVSQDKPQDCQNPTFDPTQPDRNLLTTIAPQPPACDRKGAGPCGLAPADGVDGGNGADRRR